jgi:hypothetical protein
LVVVAQVVLLQHQAHQEQRVMLVLLEEQVQ